MLVGRDVGLSEFKLGFCVAVFFAAAAVGSAFAGPFAERLGPRPALRAGLATSLLALVGAALATEWWQLPLALVVAGVGHAVMQVGANLLLAIDVPLRLQGLAFGIKQSTVPGATLVAGAVVPLVGVTLGWRWTYGLAAVAAAAVLAVEMTRRGHVTGWAARRRTRTAPRREAFTRTELNALAVVAALGAGPSNTLPAFLVAFAVDVGVTVAHAGILLALASALGLGTRILLGRLADVRGSIDLSWVARLLVVGGLAFALLPLARSQPALLWVAAGLAFAGGWGWPGLLTFIVVRENVHAAASATGVIQAGVFVGAVAGPLLFGFTVSASSYALAWVGAGAAQLLGVVLLLLLRRRREIRLSLDRDVGGAGQTL